MAAEIEEKQSHQHENPHSSAALPSIAPLLAVERIARQSTDAGRKHAPCWRQTTRSSSQLYLSSQLSVAVAFPFVWGLFCLFVFKTCRSFNLVALLLFGKLECILSIKPNLTHALPIAVVLRAEVSSLCKHGREGNGECSTAAGMVQYHRSLHFSCLAVS